MTTIPDKYIRKACITAIQAQLASNHVICPIFETEVPADTDPIPSPRIILGSQTLSQSNTTKCGHDWQSTIVIDVINEQAKGFSDKSIVEDILQLVNNAIDVSPGDMDIDPFVVYNTQFMSLNDLGYEVPTKTINRKAARYQFILGSPTPVTNGVTVDLTFQNITPAPIIDIPYNILRPNDYIPILTDTAININGSSNTNTGVLHLDYTTGDEIVTVNGPYVITPPGTPGVITVNFINVTGTLNFS